MTKRKLIIIVFTILLAATACTNSNDDLKIRTGESENWKVTIASESNIVLAYKGTDLERDALIFFLIKPQNTPLDSVHATMSLNEENMIKTQFAAFEHFPKEMPWIITIEWEGNTEIIELNPHS